MHAPRLLAVALLATLLAAASAAPASAREARGKQHVFAPTSVKRTAITFRVRGLDRSVRRAVLRVGHARTDVTRHVRGNGRVRLSLRKRRRGLVARAAARPQLLVRTAASDTRPPSEPRRLRVEALTPSSLTVAWAPARDDVGVAGYRAEVAGAAVDTPLLSHTVAGLGCGTAYPVTVRAYDAAGNLSKPVAVTATTAACVLPLPAPEPTPAPAPEPAPGPVTDPAPASRLWAVIGSGEGLPAADQRAAGVVAKVVSLSWRQWFPKEGVEDLAYVERKRDEFAQLRAQGFRLILSLGYHDVPAWVHAGRTGTRYVNQWGEPYTGTAAYDNGDADLVFNTSLRPLVDAYLKSVFSRLGGDFTAVRLGGGRWGELTYPPTAYGGRTNAYWAFGEAASATNPVPGWRPGDPSPAGEAARFLEWYLQALADYERWQIAALRAHFAGDVMMLFPSWGIRPGQGALAAAGDLAGRTSAEINGEVQRGLDFARQVAAIDDPRVVVTTTWLEADVDRAADDRSDQRYWSPVHYLAHLAQSHPLRLRLYGENGGRDGRASMDHAAAQMHRWGLMGLAWFRERELASGQYATLADLAQVIAAFGP